MTLCEEEQGGREGARCVLPGVFLLQTGDPLYVPFLQVSYCIPLCSIPQEPGVVTEDMIHEQEVILASLGTSSDAQQIRARMQSASLLSGKYMIVHLIPEDMQAFKSANTGSVLEDFVRWHSPKDWITDGHDGGKLPFILPIPWSGHLSKRMQEPGNIWREIWDSAAAIPAAKQPPLFDCNTNAEKVDPYLFPYADEAGSSLSGNHYWT